MKVALASAVPDATIAGVRAELIKAGHVMIEVSQSAVDDDSVGVVVVSAASLPDQVMSAWAVAQSCREAGTRLIGASLDDSAQLAGPVAAIPHDGDWVRISGGHLGTVPLLDALSSPTPSTAAAPDDHVGPVEVVTVAKYKRMGAAAHRMRERLAVHDKAPTAATPSVFLSYSRKDKLAEDVHLELTRHGFTVWVDKTSIPGGDDWRVSISRGIKASDVCVVLLSPNVVRHPKYIWEEIGLAQTANKPIIGVRLKRITGLPEGFDLVLGNQQHIDLYPDFAVGIGRLVESLGGPNAVKDEEGLRARPRVVVSKRDALHTSTSSERRRRSTEEPLWPVERQSPSSSRR